MAQVHSKPKSVVEAKTTKVQATADQPLVNDVETATNKKRVSLNAVIQLVNALVNDKATKQQLVSAIEDLAAGSRTIHPPKLDKDGNVVEAYCRFHERYYPVSQMVMSQGKSKGYCKAAIAKWNRANTRKSQLSAEIAKSIMRGESPSESLIKEYQHIEANMNKPSYYNAEEDWTTYNANKN